MKKIIIVLFLIFSVFIIWYWQRNHLSSYTREECLAMGAKVITLKDQLEGRLTGKVLGNISLIQDGSLCVEQ